MELYEVKITHRDSCKTYPLKRIGLSHIINWENDTPTIKDLCESDMFQKLDEPQIGCILIWLGKEKDSIKGYYHPNIITKDCKIISTKIFDYGHCAVYEGNNLMSETNVKDWRTTISLKKYSDLSKPDYILKLKQ